MINKKTMHLLQEVLKMKHGFEVTEEIYKKRETIKLPDDNQTD